MNWSLEETSYLNPFPIMSSSDNSNNHHYRHGGEGSSKRDIDTLAESFRAQANHEMRPLAVNFAPGPLDVICARGKAAKNHPGNKRFRHLIHMSLEEYSAAETKLAKSLIVSSIVDNIRLSSPDGGFVREEDGVWYEVGDHVSREKVGQR